MPKSDDGVDADGVTARLRAGDGSRPRLIVDVTDLIGGMPNGAAASGIPRVVVEFVKAGAILAREQNIPFAVGYFEQTRNNYQCLDLSGGGEVQPSQLAMFFASERFKQSARRPVSLPKIRARYARRGAKRYWYLSIAYSRIALRRLSNLVFRPIEVPPLLTRLEFRAGDIFLMLGSGWDALPLFDYIAPFRNAGLVKPIILVHDMIPILTFHLASPDIRVEGVAQANVFRAWFDHAVATTENFLTISDATRKDLLEYFDATGRKAPNIRLAYLSHEFNTPTHTTISPEIRDLLEQDFALFVGPVSGRKNARRLLEAWAKVLERVGAEKTPLLVITAGRGADAIYDTHIRSIASHVRLLNRPNDYELSQLYTHAAFTVFPSLYEGWGLPVGESLWHGTPCITSNVSSLPEVGGALCDYVDPYSVESIAHAVEKFAVDPAYRDSRAEAIRGATLRTWRDFAQDVIDAVKAYADEPNPAEPAPSTSFSAQT